MTLLTLTPWNDDHAAVDLEIDLPDAVAAVLTKQAADLRARKGSDGAASPLVYEGHKRGKNWLAILVGKNAANMERQFHNYQTRLFDYQAFAPFEPFEFGADYYTGSGSRSSNREYGVFIETSRDDRWVLASTTSAATAIKLSRALKAALEASEATTDDDAEVKADDGLSDLYGFPGACGEADHWAGPEILSIVAKLGIGKALTTEALRLLAQSAQEHAKAEAHAA